MVNAFNLKLVFKKGRHSNLWPKMFVKAALVFFLLTVILAQSSRADCNDRACKKHYKNYRSQSCDSLCDQLSWVPRLLKTYNAGSGPVKPSSSQPGSVWQDFVWLSGPWCSQSIIQYRKWMWYDVELHSFQARALWRTWTSLQGLGIWWLVPEMPWFWQQQGWLQSQMHWREKKLQAKEVHWVLRPNEHRVSQCTESYLHSWKYRYFLRFARVITSFSSTRFLR